MLFIPVLLTIFSSVFVVVNFISYLSEGRILTNKKLWSAIQLWTIVIIPALFLAVMDLSNVNDCCSDSAVFAPGHRAGIYTLIIVSVIAFVISVFRKDLFPPVAEVLLNSLLILGLILNVIFCWHFTTTDEGYLWWIFGNIPVILLLIMSLAENQKRLREYISANNFTDNSFIGKLGAFVLNLNPFLKFPVLALILVPVVVMLSLIVFVFGQKPDSFIRAFTDTYRHGFSQLDYMCQNVECGGHFLCSVGANGHREVVKPIRYGERNGHKIICNRQLLISNAFEDLVAEKFPYAHKVIRKNYNKVGNIVHRYYGIFSSKYVSDITYILMKPLEMIFLLTLYTFDKMPENRIAVQYFSRQDRDRINRMHHRKCFI